MHADRDAARKRADETRTSGRCAQEHPYGDAIGLQRHAGNASLARFLQRKDEPASTDAPGAHGGSGAKHAGKAPADIHARILKYENDEGIGLITIGSGPDQGVQVGMAGSLVGDNGKEYADFTIESAEGRVSRAHVHATQDEVNAHSNVVIKASSLESQEGKEF